LHCQAALGHAAAHHAHWPTPGDGPWESGVVARDDHALPPPATAHHHMKWFDGCIPQELLFVPWWLRMV